MFLGRLQSLCIVRLLRSADACIRARIMSLPVSSTTTNALEFIGNLMRSWSMQCIQYNVSAENKNGRKCETQTRIAMQFNNCHRWYCIQRERMMTQSHFDFIFLDSSAKKAPRVTFRTFNWFTENGKSQQTCLRVTASARPYPIPGANWPLRTAIGRDPHWFPSFFRAANNFRWQCRRLVRLSVAVMQWYSCHALNSMVTWALGPWLWSVHSSARQQLHSPPRTGLLAWPTDVLMRPKCRYYLPRTW